MKSLLSVSFLAIVGTSATSAEAVPPHHHHRRPPVVVVHPPRHRPRPPVIIVHPRPRPRHDIVVHGDCSPEVQQKNVGILESTLTQLSKSAEFQSALSFKETVAQIQAEKSMEQKIAAYCALIGVDSSSASEVAEFIGSRDQSVYIANAQKSLNLSNEQADLLVSTLKKNLLGGLNN